MRLPDARISRTANRSRRSFIPRRRRARTRPRRAASRLAPDLTRLLPAPDELRLSPALLALLGETDHLIGRLQGRLEERPDVELYIPGLRWREACASARLAGSAAPLREVLRYEFAGDEGEEDVADDEPGPTLAASAAGSSREIGSVRGCMIAARHGWERLEEASVSSTLFRAVHARLLREEGKAGMRPGRFRQVGGLSAAPRPKEPDSPDADHAVPPVPRMRQGMEQLDDFLATERFPSAALQCAFAHGHLLRMHPFGEGNGRVARLLPSLVLAQAGLLTLPVLCPSVELVRSHPERHELLAGIEDRESRDAWLAFYLRLLADAVHGAEEMVGRMREMRRDHHERLRAESRSSHATTFVDHLLERPVTSAYAAADALDVHYVTANNLIAELEELGLLREVTGRKRDRIFLYEPWVKLLEAT